jgi:fibronectin type 3 domain-containing protein
MKLHSRGQDKKLFTFLLILIVVTSFYQPLPAQASGAVQNELPPVDAGAVFAPGPDLVTARMRHRIATLESGEVAVFGGHGEEFQALDTAEVWDPASETGFEQMSMLHPHDAPAFAQLADGRFLVAGGASDDNGPGYASTEIFDPATHTFSETGEMVRYRSGAGAASLESGKVLVAGSWWYYNDAYTYGEVYDPEAGTFQSTDNGTQYYRAFPLVLPAKDGKALVVGGVYKANPDEFIIPVEQYDPETNQFSLYQDELLPAQGAVLNTIISGWGTVAPPRLLESQKLADGKYLLGAWKRVEGGMQFALFTYNPETKEFQRFGTTPELPAISGIRVVDQPIVNVDANKAYLLAQVMGPVTNNAPQAVSTLGGLRLYTVDLETGAVNAPAGFYLPPFEFTPKGMAATLLKDGRILLTGGSRDWSDGHTSARTLLITPSSGPVEQLHLEAAPGNEGIRLEWTPASSPDLDSYQVWRKDMNSQPMLITTTVGTVFTDTQDLVPYTVYYYMVFALDATEGKLAASNAARAWYAPGYEGIILKVDSGEASLMLNWTELDNPGLAYYQVARKQAEEEAFRIITTTTSTTYEDGQGLVPGKLYLYVVHAMDASGGVLAVSNIAGGKLASNVLPMLLSTESCADGIALTWTAPTNTPAASYLVKRKAYGEREFHPITTTLETAYFDPAYGLAPGQVYLYLVFALDEGGRIVSGSNVASGMVLPGDAPIQLRAESGYTSIVLNWTALDNPDLVGYRVLRRAPWEEAFKTITDTVGTTYEDSSQDLYRGHFYFYKVEALNANGDVLATSNLAQGTLIKHEVPLVLRAHSGYDSIRLQWRPTNHVEVDAYQVLRKAEGEAEFAVITTTVETYFDDASDSLVAGAVYVYLVKALDSGGQVLATSNEAYGRIRMLELWVPDVWAKPDSQVVVPVNIRNANHLRIAASDIWMDFDASVLNLTSVSPTPLTENTTWVTSTTDTGVKISLVSSPSSEMFGDGSLFWLTFQVQAQEGITTPLNLKEFIEGLGGCTVYTPADPYHPVPMGLEDGVLFVTNEQASVMGDLNGNGVVEAIDAYLALQIASGVLASTPQQLVAGDVNGNGQVEAADATMILYYAVHSQWPETQGSAVSSLQAPAAPVQLSLDSFKAEAGGTALTVLRASSLAGLAGGQFTLVYDTNLIAEVTGVRTVGLASGFTLRYNDDQSGMLTIALAKDAPVSGSGALVEISLRMAGGARPGSITQLALADAQLNDVSGRDFATSSLQTTIERQSATVTFSGFQMFLPSILMGTER